MTILSLFGLFDEAGQEFIEFRTSTNDEMFIRDTTVIHKQRMAEKENRGSNFRPALYDVQLDYPNQFTWYKLASIDAVSGETLPISPKKAVINLGSLT